MTFPLLPYFESVEEIKSLAFVGRALINYSASIDFKSVISEASGDVYVDVSNEKLELQTIIDLLNVGVSQVIASVDLANQLIEFGVPESRLIVNQTDGTNPNLGYIVPEKFQNDIKGRVLFADYRNSDFSLEKLTRGVIPIVKSSQLTTDYTKKSLIAVSEFLFFVLTTDRNDGLYTTLVTDSQNHSLGLVYSSKESINEAIKTQSGVYQSRKRGLWYKGATSGATQKLLKLDTDCDGDCLSFVVEQSGVGFCHLNTDSCFGDLNGLSKLEQTLKSRKESAPAGSYTARLFSDSKLLSAKIKEEADELIEADTKAEVAWEAADLFYFALAKCVSEGVSLDDIEKNLDLKHLKVTRRKGDAKKKYLEQPQPEKKAPEKVPAEVSGQAELPIHLKVADVSDFNDAQVVELLKRPVQSTANIMKLVNPIIENVISNGDKALIELTEKFDKVKLQSPILKAPFPPELYQLPKEIKDALDLSIDNVYKFHKAQLVSETLKVETSPGVVCSRFSRPIEKVGLYIPGGTAVLPSTALMLGVPAKVAGCKEIVFASPPGKDGKLTPEVVYVAQKVGALAIVLAGGAQAVAAMAYGTESVPKCDKILGPGNQFVTAAKMYVQNDTSALCSIDMPAGPSEVLVIADKLSDPDFVAADLLSQAEHGVDSQVILIAVGLDDTQISAVQSAVHGQAKQLERESIIRKCIEHSVILRVDSPQQAFKYSNLYAPEHLILHLKDASSYVKLVDNAGSVFVGSLTPESCGDYSSGTNHTLPTYGYARMYSGVNTGTFLKFITSQEISEQGLKSIGPAVMTVATVEGLGAHCNAVKIRMDKLGL